MGTAVVIICLICVGVLYWESRKSRPPLNIWIEDNKPLSFPQTCVINGEIASERHPIDTFKYTPPFLVKLEVLLPFSKSGWDEYLKKYPTSLRVFNSGLRSAMIVPLLGGVFGFLWAVFASPFCGLIAINDLLQRKQRMVTISGLKRHDKQIIGIDMAASSDSFPKELIRLNPSAATKKKLWKLGWGWE